MKNHIKGTCSSMEVATNALASTPRYAALALNKQTTKSIQAMERNAIKVFDFSIDLLKEVLLYILFRYKKVIQCAVTMMISGSLNAVGESAVEIGQFTNNQLSSISNALNQGLDSINNALGTINDATKNTRFTIFGKDINAGIAIDLVPVKFPGVQDKLHWTLPDTFIQSMKSLDNQNFSLDTVHEKIKQLISSPFEILKSSLEAKIKAAIANTNLTDPHAFDFLPLPAQVDSIRFCDDILPTKVVDKLVRAFNTSLYYGIAFLFAVMIVATILTYNHISKNHQHCSDGIRRAEFNINRSDFSKGGECSMRETITELTTDVNHPAINSFVRYATVSWNPGNSRRLHWFLIYCSHPVAIASIIIGLVGILTINIQILLAPWLFNSTTASIKSDLVFSMDQVTSRMATALNASVSPYITSMNQELDKIEGIINDAILGSITDLLSTINQNVITIFSSFGTEMSQLFKSLPPLATVVTGFYNCMLGDVVSSLTKIQSVLQGSAKGSIDRVTQDQFGMDAQSLLQSSNIAEGITGLYHGASDETDILFMQQLNGFRDEYIDSLRNHLIPYYIILGFGFIVVVVALISVVCDYFKSRVELDVVA